MIFHAYMLIYLLIFEEKNPFWSLYLSSWVFTIDLPNNSKHPKISHLSISSKIFGEIQLKSIWPVWPLDMVSLTKVDWNTIIRYKDMTKNHTCLISLNAVYIFKSNIKLISAYIYSCVQNNSSAAKTSENIGLLIVASMFKHTNTFEWSIVDSKPKYKCKFG